jgi:hypothetical protein
MATGIERLHFMFGEWDIQAYNMCEAGDWVESPLPKQTIIESVFDGAFIEEKEVPMSIAGTTIRFYIMWSYDQYRQTYRMLACDDHDGLADILEGNYAGNTDAIIVNNLNTGTAVLDEDGKPVYLQLASTKNSENSFTDVMSESFDNGETWLPVYRAEHTRKC